MLIMNRRKEGAQGVAITVVIVLVAVAVTTLIYIPSID